MTGDQEQVVIKKSPEQLEAEKEERFNKYYLQPHDSCDLPAGVGNPSGMPTRGPD